MSGHRVGQRRVSLDRRPPAPGPDIARDTSAELTLYDRATPRGTAWLSPELYCLRHGISPEGGLDAEAARRDLVRLCRRLRLSVRKVPALSGGIVLVYPLAALEAYFGKGEADAGGG